MITRRGLLKSSLLSCGAAVTHTGGQGGRIAVLFTDGTAADSRR
jgi:hypothetical protein